MISTGCDYTTQALRLANQQPGPGGATWTLEHIKGCELSSDACSGGLSRFYKVFMRHDISCHWCCVLHDFLYSIGGSRRHRRAADQLLRECAARAGNFAGWRGALRKAWRGFRAWVMYAAVRVFGGRHWG